MSVREASSRLCAVLLTLGAVVPTAAAGAGAVRFEDMTARLEEMAGRLLPEMAAASLRGTAYDLAWPKSPEEYRAIGSAAVLLITVVTRDAGELPLRRVYHEAKGREQALKPLRCHRSEVPAGSVIRRGLGQYREDCFFLVPGADLVRDGALLADFAANRSAYSLFGLPVPVPAGLRGHVGGASRQAGTVDEKALNALLEREYPGYRPPGGKAAGAAAGGDTQIAFSKRLGVEIFARAGAEGWCGTDVSLRVVAKDAAFFQSAEFPELVRNIGNRVVADQCAVADRALVTGVAPGSNWPRYTGHATRADGWTLKETRPTTPPTAAVPSSPAGAPLADLLTAAERGDSATIERLVDQGADVRGRDAKGETALMAACNKGHDAVVRYLISRGAEEVNARRADGATPLMQASWGGHAAVVQTLLERGAEVNATDGNGRTALIWASVTGHVAVAQALLGRGARVEARSSEGWTALIGAAVTGRVGVAQVLLAAGAAVDAKANNGTTPLIGAAALGHAPMVRLLLDHGADVAARAASGETALIAAARGGHLPVVEALVTAGADVTVKDDQGQTPMGHASLNGHEAIVKRLSTAAATDTRAAAATETIVPSVDPLRAAAVSRNEHVINDDIRGVDFQNFTYPLTGFCAEMLGRKEVTARNGEFESYPANSFAVADGVVYGDLTGDDRDDAVVVTYCGGMHPVEEPYVYTIKDGKALLLARLETGNRAFGGYKKLDIRNGLLWAERLDGKAACCPEFVVTKQYRWDGKRFAQVGKATKRKFK